jgi:hypothetical protein
VAPARNIAHTPRGRRERNPVWRPVG